MPPPDDLPNFRRLDERWLTAGQPTEEQLRQVADSGVQTIINLALPTSTGALPDERASVAALGMEYIHIPVQFDAPAAKDFEDFCAVLDERRDRRLLVHCALNYRVSAFMALYRVRRMGWQPAEALAELRQIWEPDEVWSRYLADQGLC